MISGFMCSCQGFMQNKNSKRYAICLLLTDLLYIYATTIHSTKKQHFWFVGLFLYDASIRDRKVPHSIRKRTERWGDIRWEVIVTTVGSRQCTNRGTVYSTDAQENERRFLAFKPVVLPFSSLQMIKCTLPHRMHCYSSRTNSSNRRLLSPRPRNRSKKGSDAFRSVQKRQLSFTTPNGRL